MTFETKLQHIADAVKVQAGESTSGLERIRLHRLAEVIEAEARTQRQRDRGPMLRLGELAETVLR